MMMRQPLARVVSGFFHGRHDCGYMRAERWHGPAADTNRTILLAYAVCVRALVAAMLGAGFDAGFRPVPRITAAVAARAAEVVDTAFFVGITEWYQCSVLVLHEQLFGDELLHDAQIARYRVGGSPAAAVEAAQTLKRAGFANPHDDALYLRAKARLWACDVPADS